MIANSRWYGSHRLWLEVFVLFNQAGLAADIYLAHSTNIFVEPAEYLPLYFSIVAPWLLLIAIISLLLRPQGSLWRWTGYVIGWISVGIGIAGLIFHLESRFFQDRTLDSLVYAAPFAAPLAYTGIGLLSIMNRMVDPDSGEWPQWVMLLALIGFAGNFVFSLTDHAQNGFYHWTEWIPVVSSALAVGFLAAPLLLPSAANDLTACVIVLLAQAVVGLLGFYFHFKADLEGPAPGLFDNIVYGAPVLAPLLFPNLVLLALIGIVVRRTQLGRVAASSIVTAPAVG